MKNNMTRKDIEKKIEENKKNGKSKDPYFKRKVIELEKELEKL